MAFSVACASKVPLNNIKTLLSGQRSLSSERDETDPEMNSLEEPLRAKKRRESTLMTGSSLLPEPATLLATLPTSLDLPLHSVIDLSVSARYIRNNLTIKCISTNFVCLSASLYIDTFYSHIYY